jgi:hypothetical protein
MKVEKKKYELEKEEEKRGENNKNNGINLVTEEYESQ